MADRNVKVIRSNGHETILKRMPKTASTLFDKNSLVEIVSGVVNPSDDNDTKVFGIITEEVTAADADYATAGATKLVHVLQPGDEVEITTSNTATVGASYGISNAYTVDVSDTTNKVFTVTQVLSSTKAVGVFNTVFGGADL